MRTLITILIIPLFFPFITLSGQKKFCADSSIRIKYSFPYDNAEFLNEEDTSGFNYFAGGFTQSPIPDRRAVLFKTNWGDSILWAKKLYINNTPILFNAIFSAPYNTRICMGFWGYTSTNLLLARIDANGNLLWAKRYRLSQTHYGVLTGQSIYKNILVTNNAIYFTMEFFGFPLSYETVVKTDLDGNIIWTKSLNKNYLSPVVAVIKGPPILYKDTLMVLFNAADVNVTLGETNSTFFVIAKLNSNTGALYESAAFKVTPQNNIKGITLDFGTLNSDNTFSFNGFLNVLLPTGQVSGNSSLKFNLELDRNLAPVFSSYYISSPQNLLNCCTFVFDYNNHNQRIFSYSEVNNILNNYFIIFDENNKISRSRRYQVPPIYGARASVNYDDKKNVHFNYNYKQNGRAVFEYARLSDLAPANTLNCFGIDTSILQSVPFHLTREPFTWDLEYSNIVSSYPVNPVVEPETIIKEVICKQVSYCDSLKIKGPSVLCFPSTDTRYSAYLNPQCLKNRSWQTDTAFADIVSTEADTALTLRFKKPGQFYLKSFVNNCVVADSLLITITPPQTQLGLNKGDSLLCPGETIPLTVNNIFQNYRWQDGSTEPFYNVSAPGLYTITATDSCGNNLSDSLRIYQVDTSFNIVTSLKACLYDTATVLLPPELSAITWQPSSAILHGSSLLFFPLQTTAYHLSAINTSGCSLQRNVTVEIENCPEWVRFPSAFTPDQNGLNDIFGPLVSGKLDSFTLKVFNRNGELIFNSQNPYTGWDGTYKGAKQGNGVYVYFCNYKFRNKPQVMVKGVITLIR